MKITIKRIAEKNIVAIGTYISEKGYPDTADNYLSRLKDFIYSLCSFPNKYPICKINTFSKRSFHCAIFEKTYIVVYKTTHNQLVIYNVIHGKRLK